MREQCFTTVAVLLLEYAFLGTHAVDYSDIVMLGADVCPERDSCLKNRNANFSERNCECDASCPRFGDCCVDAGRTLRTRTKRIPPLCMAYSNNYIGIYAVGNCPANYTGPSEIKNGCQNANRSDPLLAAPATDGTNRVTYVNRYCAQCNDASPSLESWLISVDCNVPNLDKDNQSWWSLSYRADMDKWGVQHSGRFHPCRLIFDKPQYITEGVRFCRPNLTSTCPSSWTRHAYRRTCESYMAVVRARRVLYRNHHCALCNGAGIDDIACFMAIIQGRKKKPFSFALLLDVNRSDGNIVGVSRPAEQNCSAGQKYDPFFKKCRTLVCAIPGYSMVNGKCVKR